jgi:hypothetical protein
VWSHGARGGAGTGGKRGGDEGGSGGGGGEGSGAFGGEAGGDGGGVKEYCRLPLHLQHAMSGVTSTPYKFSMESHAVFSQFMPRDSSSVKKKASSLHGPLGGGDGRGGGDGGEGDGGDEGGGGGGGGGFGGLGGGLGSCENACDAPPVVRLCAIGVSDPVQIDGFDTSSIKTRTNVKEMNAMHHKYPRGRCAARSRSGLPENVSTTRSRPTKLELSFTTKPFLIRTDVSNSCCCSTNGCSCISGINNNGRCSTIVPFALLYLGYTIPYGFVDKDF